MFDAWSDRSPSATRSQRLPVREVRDREGRAPPTREEADPRQRERRVLRELRLRPLHRSARLPPPRSNNEILRDERNQLRFISGEAQGRGREMRPTLCDLSSGSRGGIDLMMWPRGKVLRCNRSHAGSNPAVILAPRKTSPLKRWKRVGGHLAHVAQSGRALHS